MTERLVAYTRVSTDIQADEGASLRAQHAKLAAFAAAMDIELVGVVEDAGFSAASLERPGLQRALSMLQSGEADGVLVVKLDRLTRSVRDLDFLLENYFADRAKARQCRLVSVGDSIDTRTASGRLVLHILGSVAQWEREAIAERIRASMSQLRAEGRKLGGHVPFGYRVSVRDGKKFLIPEEQEQRAIELIRSLKASGKSQRKIVRAVKDEMGIDVSRTVVTSVVEQ